MGCGKELDRAEASGEYCHDCIRRPRSFAGGIALLNYNEGAKKVIYGLKYQNKRDAARFLALAQSDYVTYDFTVSATPEQGNVITVSTPNMLGDESSVPCFSDDYLHETLSTQNGHENSTEFIILAIDKDGETLFKLLSNNNTTNRTVEINSETYTINVVGWN